MIAHENQSKEYAKHEQCVQAAQAVRLAKAQATHTIACGKCNNPCRLSAVYYAIENADYMQLIQAVAQFRQTYYIWAGFLV